VPVGHELPVAPERQTRNLVEVLERVEPGEREKAVLGFPDEHAGDLGCSLHRFDRRRRDVRAEAEERGAVAPSERHHFGHIGDERGRRARKDDERWREPFGVELGDEVRRAAAGGGQIDDSNLAAAIAHERRAERQRERRLGRAENFFPLLAATLARKRDAADKRWIDEERAFTQHVFVSASRGFRRCQRFLDRGQSGGRNGLQLNLAAPPADRKDTILGQFASERHVPVARPDFLERL
jgi:hypothetical protein